MKIIFGGTDFIASTLRSLYHPKTETLILSDCHIGKAAHFRKNHIPIPAHAGNPDFINIHTLLNYFSPVRCVFLGDLFHSEYNSDWEKLTSLIANYPNTRFELVEGNHDILQPSLYKSGGIDLYKSLSIENILLLHDPQAADSGQPIICGHIHPGFGIAGKARQNITVPCFYMYRNTMIMPAFGSLTGLKRMNHLRPGKAICFTGKDFYEIENE